MSRYFDSTAINQSMLKLFGNNCSTESFYFGKKKTLHDDCDKEHYTIGQLLDLFIQNDAEKLSSVRQLKKRPKSKSALTLMEYLYDNEISCSDVSEVDLHQICNDLGIYGGSFKNKRNDLLYSLKEYYEEALEAKRNGFLACSESEYLTAKKIKDSIFEATYLKHYTSQINPIWQAEIYFQHVVEDENYNYTTVEGKAKPDQLIINCNEKTIEIVDYKTMGQKTNTFFKSYLDWRYDMQAAYYTLAVQKLINNQAVIYINDELCQFDFSGYRIKSFDFVAETTDLNNIGTPKAFTLTREQALKGLEDTQISGRKLFGIDTALKNYVYFEKMRDSMNEEDFRTLTKHGKEDYKYVCNNEKIPLYQQQIN